MIKLYHGDTSVCSAKVRILLAEKGLEWESHLVDMLKGEHQSADYLAINPEGEVPALVHEDFVLTESSAIVLYLDALSDDNTLLPADSRARARTHWWLIHCIDMHAAVMSLTFATLFRVREMANTSTAEMEARMAKMDNPEKAAKRLDIFRNGLDSPHVGGAIHTFEFTLKEMQQALEGSRWLAGDSYGLADLALMPYIDRLQRIGMEGFWEGRYPAVGDWLKRCQQRPSYEIGIASYYSPDRVEQMRATAGQFWPEIAERLT